MFKINFGKFLKKKADESVPEQKAKQEKFDNKAEPKFSLLGLFRKKKKEEDGKGIEYFKKEIRKQEKKRAIVQDRRKRLGFYLEKAGLSLDPRWLSKNIFNLCVVINLVISAFLIYHFSTTFGVTWTTIL